MTKVLDQLCRSREPADVRDELVDLDGVEETSSAPLFLPRRDSANRRPGVEWGIEFDRVERLCIMTEPIARLSTRRIEAVTPVPVEPT